MPVKTEAEQAEHDRKWTAKLAARLEKDPKLGTRFLDLSTKLRERGHTKIPVQTILQKLRFDAMMRGKTGNGFKLSNTYRKFLARWAEGQDSRLLGLFTTPANR